MTTDIAVSSQSPSAAVARDWWTIFYRISVLALLITCVLLLLEPNAEQQITPANMLAGNRWHTSHELIINGQKATEVEEYEFRKDGSIKPHKWSGSGSFKIVGSNEVVIEASNPTGSLIHWPSRRPESWIVTQAGENLQLHMKHSPESKLSLTRVEKKPNEALEELRSSIRSDQNSMSARIGGLSSDIRSLRTDVQKLREEIKKDAGDDKKK